MPENNQNYNPSNLQFSSSKLYFQHQNHLLQKMGFISPMTIDIYYKYTFQEVHDRYFIEGGEYQGITADHDVHEEGIIYKVGFANPKFKNVKMLSLDLSKSENKSMLPLVLTIFLWGAVFGLLYRFAQYYILGQILFRLNVVGAFIVFCFYIRQLGNSGYKSTVGVDKGKSGKFKVKYSDQSELAVITDDVLEVLKKISDELWIIKFAFSGNCVFLLQDVHDHHGKKLPTTGKIYSEQEKASLQQKTMDFIRQPDFLSHFMEN